MKKILSISRKLNFAPNTLGSYGFIISGSLLFFSLIFLQFDLLGNMCWLCALSEFSALRLCDWCPSGNRKWPYSVDILKK